MTFLLKNFCKKKIIINLWVTEKFNDISKLFNKKKYMNCPSFSSLQLNKL